MSINGISNNQDLIQKTIFKDSGNKNKISIRDTYGIPHGITIDQAMSYYPNIEKISPEDLFDAQYADGTKLSTGSVLVRPVILSLGDVEITPLQHKKGHYLVSRTPIGGIEGQDTKSSIMTEQELRENKILCSGTISKSSGGKYTLDFTTRDGAYKHITADKKECLKVLKENMLYM